MHHLYGNSDRCQACIRCMEGVCIYLRGSVMGGSTVDDRCGLNFVLLKPKMYC